MSFDFLTEKSCLFAQAYPHELTPYVAEHIGRHELRLSTGPAAACDEASARTARLAHRRCGDVNVCRLSYGQEARVLTDGLEEIYHLQLVLKGHCHYDLGNISYLLGPAQMLVINPRQPIDIHYSGDCEKLILTLPASLVRDICLEHRWPFPDEGINFSQAPRRFDELEGLTELIDLLCREAESGVEAPQINALYIRLIAHKLVSLQPPEIVDERADFAAVTFRDIERYIEGNLKRDICVEELAQEAKMSRRSLYMLFDKYARTTPKNFIRQKKLEAVYNALINPACHVANITTLALDYGFTHLGRFSEIYREAFGILPSDTLKKRQTRRIS